MDLSIPAVDIPQKRNSYERLAILSFRQLPSSSVSFRPQPYALGPEDGRDPLRETGGSYTRPDYQPFLGRCAFAHRMRRFRAQSRQNVPHLKNFRMAEPRPTGALLLV